jgi:hypothetical protein
VANSRRWQQYAANSSGLQCSDNEGMDAYPAITQALLLFYRLANYATINLVDDAASSRWCFAERWGNDSWEWKTVIGGETHRKSAN